MLQHAFRFVRRVVFLVSPLNIARSARSSASAGCAPGRRATIAAVNLSSSRSRPRRLRRERSL